MKQKLRQIFYNWWSGLWFIPGLLTLAGLLLGGALSNIFHWGIFTSDSEPVFRPSLAVSVLTSLAGASITVVGVVFSITMVVLSSASAQLGPRLLTNFLKKTGTKLAIGGFVASFAYQLLVAAALSLGQPVIDLAVWVGLIGGLGSFAILLSFLHLVARFIQVPFVVGEVTENFSRTLESFCEHSRGGEGDLSQVDARWQEPSFDVVAKRDGFLQDIDVPSLIAIARKREGVIRLLVRAGQFVAAGEVIALVYTDLRDGSAEEVADGVLLSISLGAERTAQQDVEFALRQLVEIATKALSPGINDPETAITVIDRLGGAISKICNQELPNGLWFDQEEKLRLSIPLSDAAGLMDAAYHPLRQFASPVPGVALRLMMSYRQLAKRELHPSFEAGLRRHIDLLAKDVARQDWLEEDRSQLEEIQKEALEKLP